LSSLFYCLNDLEWPPAGFLLHAAAPTDAAVLGDACPARRAGFPADLPGHAFGMLNPVGITITVTTGSLTPAFYTFAHKDIGDLNVAYILYLNREQI
jgi:hypothetical protein